MDINTRSDLFSTWHNFQNTAFLHKTINRYLDSGISFGMHLSVAKLLFKAIKK